MWRWGAAFVAVMFLGACAGRPPELIPLVQTADTQLSCAQIQAETQINNERISKLATEQNWKMGQNVVAGIVGFAVWPAWLGLDFQNAAGKDATALTQRNEYLLALANERCRTKTETASAAPSSLDLPFAPVIASSSLGAGLTTSLVER
jgi:hypothetical protein